MITRAEKASQGVLPNVPSQHIVRTNPVRSNENTESFSAESSASKRPTDVLTISEDANIDYSLFNYLDNGGDAARVLEEGTGGKKEFAPKPNFSGMGITRYSQMKSEIERNFDNNPELKNKYLRELDKTLEDYIRLQARLADSLSGKQDDENSEGKTESESEEAGKLRAIYNSGSSEVKAIIDKVLGDSDSALPDELSKAIDEYFIEVFRQKTGAQNKLNIFNQEVTEDSRTKDIWRAVRLHIDSEE